MSSGMEHFFRELGQLYKIYSVSDPNNEIGLKTPEYYAELLISGHTIELLDGDAGTISEAWFSAICGHISNKFPDLRVFVISILGLQSSGKSTLLNALFACRFAVSVGRCTRGLFMRLLFLEKDLSDQLNIDAIILIDTEGLVHQKRNMLYHKNIRSYSSLFKTCHHYVKSRSNLALILRVR